MNDLLESGTTVVLRVEECVKFPKKTFSGSFPAVVENDVYSADGSQVLIKAGTPSVIEFNAERNGFWGKAGKVCLTFATTRTVDNKKIVFRLDVYRRGICRTVGAVITALIFFPLGLFAGFIRGCMPKIQYGTTFNAIIVQDVLCNQYPEVK